MISLIHCCHLPVVVGDTCIDDIKLSGGELMGRVAYEIKKA